MSAAIKAHALFLTAAVAFRFVQRRTIAEFTRFDWVTAPDTSWLTGSAALLTLLVAHGTSRGCGSPGGSGGQWIHRYAR